jgi:hypothetical protein
MFQEHNLNHLLQHLGVLNLQGKELHLEKLGHMLLKEPKTPRRRNWSKKRQK